MFNKIFVTKDQSAIVKQRVFVMKNTIDTDNNDSNDTHNLKDALVNNLIDNHSLPLANTIYNLTLNKNYLIPTETNLHPNKEK